MIYLIDVNKELKLFKEAFNNSIDIMFFCYNDGKILNANKEAIIEYGYSYNEFLKLNILNLCDKSNKNSFTEVNTEFEDFNYRKDGTKFPAEIRLSYIEIDNSKYILIIIKNITIRQKKLEDIGILASIVESSEDAIMSLNLDGIIKSWNKGAEKLYGYSEDEVIGKSILIILPESTIDGIYNILQSIRNGIVVENYETIRKKKDGQIVYVSITASPIYDFYGAIIGASTIARDMTEKQKLINKLMEDEHRLKGIYNSMKMGLALGEIILDNNGKPIDFMLLHMNESIEKILNMKSEDIIEKNMLNYLKEAEKLWFDLFVDVAINGKDKHVEKYNVKLDKYFEIDIYSPNPNQFSLLVADVTEKKKKEKELIEKYEELSAVYEELTATEEELRDNYKALEKINEALEKANLAKSQFLANMSHELRTPLNGILGFTQLLQLTKLSNEQRDDLLMIEGSSHHLLEIINDILDLSKIGANKMKIENEKFNIKKMLENIIKELYVAKKDKDIEIMYNVDPFIDSELIGDGIRLKQVLINLIHNAVKFTERGHIYFRVKKIYKNLEETKLEFSIEDTGIGISEEFKNKIFEIFCQEETTYTKKYGGTGLGLAISKQLVNLMGGDIWFTSKINEGSIFYFTAVFKNCNEQNYFKSNNDEILNEKACDNDINILIVEDNEINLKITSAFLKQLNYKYNYVRNGQEAVDYIDNNKVDIILMDIQMPVLSGFEATKIIRNKESKTKEHKIIIAMTAYAMEGDREKFLSCGMDDYISKSFDMRTISSLINKYVEILEK